MSYFVPTVPNTSISSPPYPSPNSPPTHTEFTMYLFLVLFFALIFFVCLTCVYYSRRPSTSSDNPTPTDGSTTAATNQMAGLDPSFIGSLPVIAYGGGAEEGVTEECPICLNQFEESETVKSIPKCRHVFHARCIDTWLSSQVSCPLCRSTQMSDDAVGGFSGATRPHRPECGCTGQS